MGKSRVHTEFSMISCPWQVFPVRMCSSSPLCLSAAGGHPSADRRLTQDIQMSAHSHSRCVVASRAAQPVKRKRNLTCVDTHSSGLQKICTTGFAHFVLDRFWWKEKKKTFIAELRHDISPSFQLLTQRTFMQKGAVPTLTADHKHDSVCLGWPYQGLRAPGNIAPRLIGLLKPPHHGKVTAHGGAVIWSFFFYLFIFFKTFQCLKGVENWKQTK